MNNFERLIECLKTTKDLVGKSLNEYGKVFSDVLNVFASDIAIGDFVQLDYGFDVRIYIGQEKWSVYPRIIISNSGNETINIVISFDLEKKELSLCLLHSTEEINEEWLHKVFESTKFWTIPNGCVNLPNYWGNSEKPCSLQCAPENGIIFLKRYAEPIREENFKSDLKEALGAYKQIMKYN